MGRLYDALIKHPDFARAHANGDLWALNHAKIFDGLDKLSEQRDLLITHLEKYGHLLENCIKCTSVGTCNDVKALLAILTNCHEVRKAY